MVPKRLAFFLHDTVHLCLNGRREIDASVRSAVVLPAIFSREVDPVVICDIPVLMWSTAQFPGEMTTSWR